MFGYEMKIEYSQVEIMEQNKHSLTLNERGSSCDVVESNLDYNIVGSEFEL